MAHGSSEEGWSAEMDRTEHENTFNLFYMLLKWGTIICVVILILMAIFLV